VAQTITFVPTPGSQSLSAPALQPQFTQAIPLSLYVHIPWCVRKCPYCDFNSHNAPEQLPENALVDALLKDLTATLPGIWGRRVETVFFGGGTPSLLSPAAIDQLLTGFRTLLPLSPQAEITLEANPGTVDAQRFSAFRDAGITRLSLGIQSFNDASLQVLGRIHDRQQAIAAIEAAARYFETFNLDLMVGLPHQDVTAALADINQALSFAPPHFSCYQLTLEPHTPFAATPPAGLPDDDTCAEIQDALESRLAEAGYSHYETSAFARPGHSCRHNLNYWIGDYLGIGAGAHSKLTLHDRVLRQMRHKHPKAYLDNIRSGNAVQEHNEVAPASLPFEFLMNALRLADGFHPSLFEARTAQPLGRILPQLKAAEAAGLLAVGPEKIAPTAKGRRFLNVLLEKFL